MRSFIAIGQNTATGTINLNGGTLATGRNFVRDGNGTADATGTANFVFGGGTLKALANQTDWLNSSTKNTNQLALTSVTTTAVSTIDSNGFSVGINNAISGAGGFNIINSTGTGTVTFGGANTYTGGTTVNAGILALGNATNTLADTGAVTVSGGTLDIAANSDTVGAVTLTSGSITGTTGTLTGSSYDMRSGTASAILGGTGALTKSTGGTVTLSGANTYSGNTTIKAGTLALGSTGSFNNSPVITVGNSGSTGTVLDLTAKASGFHILSGQTVAGIGTITMAGGQTLTVDSGAHWAPGNSIGTDSVTGNLTLAGSSDFQLGNSTGAGTCFAIQQRSHKCIWHADPRRHAECNE